MRHEAIKGYHCHWTLQLEAFYKTCSCHVLLTYGPRKAVAEVSNHNEPIGRGVWSSMFESQLMSGSSELRVKWFGCHLIRDSSDLVVI